MEYFPGEIDFRGKRYGYFWILFAIIFCGLLAYVSGEKEFLTYGGIGFGFFFLILLAMDIPFLNFYLISEKNIISIRMGLPNRFLRSKIADIRLLHPDEIKEMTDDAWVRMTLTRHHVGKGLKKDYVLGHLDEISPNIKSSMGYNWLMSVCTSSPSIKVYKGRAETEIKDIEYVILTMDNGRQYLMSPKRPQEFMKIIQK